MEQIGRNGKDSLLKDMRYFILKFNSVAIQEHNDKIQTFGNALLRLQNGFDNINEKEKVKKNETFKREFKKLILKIQDAQENGQWRKTHFNIFETLGIQRNETVHSNLIAWLLNPEEAHGLGDVFLRKFVKQIFKKELPLYFPVDVNRELREGADQPDIIVEGNNWWLVIENKIDSPEGEKQTLRYAQRWKAKGKIGENVFLILLSPSQLEPESNDFCSISYRTIRELLENIQFQGDSNILSHHFIEHILLNFEE